MTTTVDARATYLGELVISVPNASIVWDNDAENALPEEQDVNFSYQHPGEGCALSDIVPLYSEGFDVFHDRVVRVEDLIWDINQAMENATINHKETASVLNWLVAVRNAFPDLEVRIFSAT